MPSKMYILMRREIPHRSDEYSEMMGEEVQWWEEVDDGHVALGACHGVLMCHLKYSHTEAYQDWLKNSFRKVLCVVNENEWWTAMGYCYNKVIVTESAFGGEEIGMVFAPREEWPPFFKSLRLFKGKGDLDVKKTEV